MSKSKKSPNVLKFKPQPKLTVWEKNISKLNELKPTVQATYTQSLLTEEAISIPTTSLNKTLTTLLEAGDITSVPFTIEALGSSGNLTSVAGTLVNVLNDNLYFADMTSKGPFLPADLIIIPLSVIKTIVAHSPFPSLKLI